MIENKNNENKHLINANISFCFIFDVDHLFVFFFFLLWNWLRQKLMKEGQRSTYLNLFTFSFFSVEENILMFLFQKDFHTMLRDINQKRMKQKIFFGLKYFRIFLKQFNLRFIEPNEVAVVIFQELKFYGFQNFFQYFFFLFFVFVFVFLSVFFHFFFLLLI